MLDAAGNAWLAASTTSADFPVTAGRRRTRTFNGVGGRRRRRAERRPARRCPIATFLGGSQSEGGNDIGRDSAGNLYVTGRTFSMDFPATVGAFDTVWNGDLSIFWGDAFVTKLSLDRRLDASRPAAVPAAPGAAGAGQRREPRSSRSASTGATCRARRRTRIEIDDSSAFTRAARAHADRHVVVVPRRRPADDDTLFWRVRGVNSAGTPGACSAVPQLRAAGGARPHRR